MSETRALAVIENQPVAVRETAVVREPIPVRFPGVENRTVVCGSTGSGKTRFGAFLLSAQSWRKMPWIVVDFKGEKLFQKIEDAGGAKSWPLKANPPRRPGVYIIRPKPHELEELDVFLWKIWKYENIGVFVDEGLMIPKSKAMNAILTQGRSKHIPVITLTQRPAWLSRFVFSESEFFCLFRLNDADDVNTVRRFMSVDPRGKRLPYHSLWYDAGLDAAVILRPVPSDAEIIARFGGRKPSNKRIV